jgi:hypothetical protein
MKALFRPFRSLGRYWPLLMLLLMIALVLRQDGPPPGEMETGIDRIIADVRFDFDGWEMRAVWSKLTFWLLQPQRYMHEVDRVAFVRDYVTRLADISALQDQIDTAYADPQVTDPGAATAGQQRRLAGMRAQAAARQPLVEAIIEEQVATVLTQEGIGFLGQEYPPVGLRFTPLPYALIVSPRERIEPIYQATLEYGLDVAQREEIEARVDREFNVSSLASEIGGLSAWPAMALEYPSLEWITEVTAHEWSHYYMNLHPLGWEYDRSREARTINETAAEIVGREAGRAVLARYYPDLLPPPPSPADSGGSAPSSEPPAFDFRAEMHATRVEVDRLLAAGQVEEAEQYMEARRRFFWEHGYRIRKLNQAYFALHGSYADQPGAAGEDPIGPAVRELRQHSANLGEFLARVSSVTTLSELQALLARVP